MIIRKPYAFLIKYFKIIHIILFVLMTYLLFSVRYIYMFFVNYVKTGTYSYVIDMVSKYVSLPMIITTIILISFLLLIFFLMRQKKKPVVYYMSATIFYIITFISFIVLMNFYTNLEFVSYSNQVIVIYRDLTMILYYFNFFFLIIAFIRGFGFNVKKFNFEKDIKELDITDEDREEIEVGTVVDYENVSNFFRKRRRLFRYYLKENSFILIVFLVIIILSTTAYITVDKLVFNKIYKETDLITLNNIDYTINNSYITNKDSQGNYVKNKDTYYLVVNFNVLNKNLKTTKLEIENYRVRINNKYYYPIKNIGSKFNDLGKVYKNQSLLTNTNNNYIIVFEIDNIKNSKIVFELYNYKRVIDGDVILYYKDVVLKPIYDHKESIGTYKLMEKVSLEKTYFMGGTFNLNSYEIVDIIDYTYTKCDNLIDNGACTDYKASVVPSAGKIILKIEYAISLDDIKIFNFLNIKYKNNDKSYTISSNDIKDITPDNYHENIVLLEVPSILKGASDIEFLFDIRGVSFLYKS